MVGYLGKDTSKKLTLHEIRLQIYPSDRRGMVKKAFSDTLLTGDYKFETTIVKPDNTIACVQTIGKVFYDEIKPPVIIIGTLRDITQDEINQQALERSERRLRYLILNAPVSIEIPNGPDYILEIINESALRLTGKTKQQMLNKPVLEVMTELDIAQAKLLLDNVFFRESLFLLQNFL